jgi:hypothetical protein
MTLWNIRPKCSPTHFSSKLKHKLDCWIKGPEKLGYFCKLYVTVKGKQSPIGRKFAQSGHSGRKYYVVGGVASARICFRFQENLEPILRLWFTTPIPSQSYNFWIYSYNASVVVGLSVFTSEKNDIYFKNAPCSLLSIMTHDLVAL